MAKKRKSSYKKSAKCPEPINTLIDIAGALVMGAIASSKEKKYHYTAKGKINPYAASAFGIATGRMKSTKDILDTGAFLGAMGSFDVESNNRINNRRYGPNNPVFNQIRDVKVNDNRYAWRLNCQDGSEYGIDPTDYETREEYNLAIKAAKGEDSIQKEENTFQCVENDEPQTTIQAMYCCRVSRLDNGANEYYLTSDSNITVGDTISIQTDKGTTQGVVIAVKALSDMNENEIPDESMWVISQDEK